MVQIINFSIITGDNTKVIGYTFNILDSNGAIQKANIKRSLPITSDTVLLNTVNTNNILEIANSIKEYLISNTII